MPISGGVLGVEAKACIDKLLATRRPSRPEGYKFLLQPVLEDHTAVRHLGCWPVLLRLTEVSQQVPVLSLLIPHDSQDVGFLLPVSAHPLSRALVAVEDDQAGNSQERQDGARKQQDVLAADLGHDDAVDGQQSLVVLATALDDCSVGIALDQNDHLSEPVLPAVSPGRRRRVACGSSLP